MTRSFLSIWSFLDHYQTAADKVRYNDNTNIMMFLRRVDLKILTNLFLVMALSRVN